MKETLMTKTYAGIPLATKSECTIFLPLKKIISVANIDSNFVKKHTYRKHTQPATTKWVCEVDSLYTEI